MSQPYVPRTTPLSQNQLRYYRLLLVKKYRMRDRKFLLEGVRVIEEALAARASLDAVVLIPQALYSERARRLAEALEQAGVPLLAADRRAFRTLADTVQSQGMVGIAHWPYGALEPEQLPERGIVVALNGLADPGNAGTIVRTCAWFGVQALLCDRTTVDITNPKTVRSTAGAIFHLPIYEEVDLGSILPKLRQKGFSLFYTDVRARTELRSLAVPPACLVVFGAEASGIDPLIAALCHEGIRIERYGGGDSLNVAVAAGVILAYLAAGQHRPPKSVPGQQVELLV